MPWTPPAHWTPKELRFWRAEHDLTQSDAARLFAVAQSTYAYWEAYREPRDFDAMMAAAELARLKDVDPRIQLGESVAKMHKRLAREDAKQAKALARSSEKAKRADAEHEAHLRGIARKREQPFEVYLRQGLDFLTYKQEKEPNESRLATIARYRALLENLAV